MSVLTAIVSVIDSTGARVDLPNGRGDYQPIALKLGSGVYVVSQRDRGDGLTELELGVATAGLTFGTASSLVLGGANGSGSTNSLARSDHMHQVLECVHDDNGVTHSESRTFAVSTAYDHVEYSATPSALIWELNVGTNGLAYPAVVTVEAELSERNIDLNQGISKSWRRAVFDYRPSGSGILVSIAEEDASYVGASRALDVHVTGDGSGYALYVTFTPGAATPPGSMHTSWILRAKIKLDIHAV
jgi:hypothetical protein